MMRRFILVTLISAGAAKCQGGQCAVDDETSLMQKTAKLHDPDKVKKLQQDWAVFKSDMDDALSVEQDQVLKNKTVDHLGGVDGFFGPIQNGQKCFLSKRTVFTVPNIVLNKGCDAASPMHRKDDFLNKDMMCQACMRKMQDLPVQLAIRTNYFTGHTYYGDQTHPVIKAIEKGGFMEDVGTELPASCKHCDSLSRDVCISQGDRTGEFNAQQTYMLRMAQELTKHGVELYLDFQDEAGDKMIKDYGGRSVAFNTPLLEALMMTLLAVRAYESQHFIHWEGAYGSYCMAEHFFGFQNPHHGNLNSAPVGYLFDQKGKNAECGAERRADASQVPFARRICEMCGGHHCNMMCR